MLDAPGDFRLDLAEHDRGQNALRSLAPDRHATNSSTNGTGARFERATDNPGTESRFRDLEGEGKLQLGSRRFRTSALTARRPTFTLGMAP